MTFQFDQSRSYRGQAPVIRHVLFEFDGPKMVLAVDDRGRQLLGVAADEDDEGTIRWLFVPAPPERMLALLRTRAGLRTLFDSGMIDIYDIQSPWQSIRAWSLAPEDVPEELLPERDAELPELLDDVRGRLIAEQQTFIEQRTRVARSRMFFDGGPVRGRRGIATNFAADALSRYQSLVSLAYASRRQGNLASTGPIPGRTESTLMLADMPRGSVGFELVEDMEQASVLQTDLSEVVTKVAALLDAAATHDTLYAEAVAEFDKRVVAGVHDFFGILKKAEASLRLEVRSKEYRFDSARISEAMARTESELDQEDDRPVPGTLIGFLPTDHRFELLTTSGQLIKGKVARDADAAAIAALFNKPCIAHLWVVKIERLGEVTEALTLMRVAPPGEGSL